MEIEAWEEGSESCVYGKFRERVAQGRQQQVKTGEFGWTWAQSEWRKGAGVGSETARGYTWEETTSV